MTAVKQVAAAFNDDTKKQTSHFYVTMGLMAFSAVVLSGAVIIFFDDFIEGDALAGVCNSVELAAVTLMPYMISAAVAAITAIGIMAILPVTRMSGSLQTIQVRLRDLASGDLSTRVRVESNSDQIRQLANDLNRAIGDVGQRIAEWKIINRQQWGILESIRHEAARKDCDAVLLLVEQMENNWRKTAAIETELIT